MSDSVFSFFFEVNVSGEDIKQRLKIKATKSRIKQEGEEVNPRIALLL